MNNINSLTAEIERLNGSVNWWNSAIVIMMVLAASAAVGLLITQYIAFKRAEQLANSEAQLNLAKDAKLALDLKDKDQKIGETNKAAGEALLAAGKANERAAELEKENLLLQQKLANRRLTKKQHDVLIDFLSKRQGTVTIETMSDSESGLYAADLLKTFTDAHWKIADKNFPLGVVWIGLIVYQSSDPNALTIAEAFKAAGIPFSIGTETRQQATIMVGGKPPMF